MEEKFRSTGREMFNDLSDFYAMSTVLYKMIDDSHNDGTKFGLTYVIVDAIEELCVKADEELHTNDDSESVRHHGSPIDDMLRLIKKTAQLSPHIKWLISVDREKVPDDCKEATIGLTPTNEMTLKIDDEHYSNHLKDEVIKKYVSLKAAKLAKRAGFRDPFQRWVNMACCRLESHGLPWNATMILDQLPGNVKSLYREAYAMINTNESTKAQGHIKYRNIVKDRVFFADDQAMCRRILFTMAISYRILLKSEVARLANLLAGVDLEIIVNNMCSSFLEFSDGHVCFVRPSARHFIGQCLVHEKAVSSKHLEMTGVYLQHALVKSNSNLGTYAIINWMRHFCGVRGGEDLTRTIEAVNQFFSDHFLEWIEILTKTQILLLEAVTLLQKLNAFLQEKVRENINTDLRNTSSDRDFLDLLDKWPPPEKEGNCIMNAQ